MATSRRWATQGALGRFPEADEEDQLDLFDARGVLQPRPTPQTPQQDTIPPRDLDDAALIGAIPDAGVIEGPALAEEAGRRRLAPAVAALERLCLRFAGFGVAHLIPEQVAALEALAEIGGPEAARAVTRLTAKGIVQGPTLVTAVEVAARLGSDLPSGVIMPLLHHRNRMLRANACRCVRVWPEAIPVLLDLLHDPEEDVRVAAACALGRQGRREALPAVTALLAQAPSAEVIDATTPIADEDCVVLLARIARTRPDLAAPALEALEVIEHPRAVRVLATLADDSAR
jgi:hypothetical protein